jgi:hypothetical protein
MICVLFAAATQTEDAAILSILQSVFTVPVTFVRSAFGDAWQRAGFKVQLSVHKDGACIAGRREAAKQ